MDLRAILVAIALGAVGLAAQAPGMSAAASLPAGTKIKAELRSNLDSRTAHVGQAIEAEVRSDVKVHGKKILPKGSKLLGTVLAVTPAESAKSPSSITFVFAQAEIKHGGRMALDATLTGLQRPYAPPPPADMPPIPTTPSSDSDNPAMINQGSIPGRMGAPPVDGMPDIANGKSGGLPAQKRAAPLHVATIGNKIRVSSTGDIVLSSGTRLEFKAIVAGGGQ